MTGRQFLGVLALLAAGVAILARLACQNANWLSELFESRTLAYHLASDAHLTFEVALMVCVLFLSLLSLITPQTPMTRQPNRIREDDDWEEQDPQKAFRCMR